MIPISIIQFSIIFDGKSFIRETAEPNFE